MDCTNTQDDDMEGEQVVVAGDCGHQLQGFDSSQSTTIAQKCEQAAAKDHAQAWVLGE